MTSLQNIIRRSKKFYFQEWRGHEKICPAFGEKVYVTRWGWRHLVDHPRRSLSEKVRRLKKLPMAREILENSNTYQQFQIKGDFYFYGIIAIKNNEEIKVVVASHGKKGRKFFLSLMSKKIKNKLSPLLDQ